MKTAKKMTLASGLLFTLFNTQAATLYVDGTGTCASLTPCYTTIQTAVTNAVSNDDIRVFPGTYIEVVDVSQMGSANGPAADGNISFITVDSNNMSTPHTAQVAPLAGIAFTHTNPFFVGNIVIDGFDVVSTDDDGIDFDLVGGDITIRNMIANGSNNDGIDVEVSNGSRTITITDTVVNNNGSSGLNLDGPDGTVVFVQNIEANQNISEGIDIDNATNTDNLTVTILDSVTRMNGTMANGDAGTVVRTRGTLTIRNLNASNNEGPGLALLDLTQTNISDSIFENNGPNTTLDGIFLAAGGTVTIERSRFIDNGDTGIWVTDANGVDLTDLNVTCSQFTGNNTGVYIEASATASANYTVNSNNITGNDAVGMHSEINNNSISATDNWWGSDTGPTHALNVGGMGDVVSDSNDVVLVGALGVITYTPFRDAPLGITQFATDTIFANDFEGNPCSQL